MRWPTCQARRWLGLLASLAVYRLAERLPTAPLLEAVPARYCPVDQQDTPFCTLLITNVMTTFTLAIIGYLNTRPEQSGLTFEQVKTLLTQHRELYPSRVAQALEWAEKARPGESWQTSTDLRESDQADIYLTRE